MPHYGLVRRGVKEDMDTENSGHAWLKAAHVMTVVAPRNHPIFELDRAGYAHHFATMADSFLGRITSIACVSSSCGYASMTLAAIHYCAQKATVLSASPPGKKTQQS